MNVSSGHYVTLGDGLRVALGAYVQTWREVRAMAPGQSLDRSLTDRGSSSAGEVLRQFRAGLHDRINRHDPRVGCRKLDPDWQRHTAQLARRVNTPRLVVHEGEVPAEFRAKLAHRLTTPDDF